MTQTDRDTPVTALRQIRDFVFASLTINATDRHRLLTAIDAALASSDDVAGSGERPMDDRLVRHLPEWLQQADWVRDYEHARAEAEGFANQFADTGERQVDDAGLMAFLDDLYQSGVDTAPEIHAALKRAGYRIVVAAPTTHALSKDAARPLPFVYGHEAWCDGRHTPGECPAPTTEAPPKDAPFQPDYDWTATCPHDGDNLCPEKCRCECHAVPTR